MRYWHGRGRTVRRGTGAKRKKFRDKRKWEIGGEPARTRLKKGLEKNIAKKRRARGGNIKWALKFVSYVNVIDPKTGQAKKVRILRVLETPDNRHFARRNIITKGTIVETELGKARITSRPGQENVLNAVLLQ